LVFLPTHISPDACLYHGPYKLYGYVVPRLWQYVIHALPSTNAKDLDIVARLAFAGVRPMKVYHPYHTCSPSWDGDSGRFGFPASPLQLQQARSEHNKDPETASRPQCKESRRTSSMWSRSLILSPTDSIPISARFDSSRRRRIGPSM
jgi:hypothetical protein